MAPLAGLPRLVARLGQQIDLPDRHQAVALLRYASHLVRAFCGDQFEQGAGDEVQDVVVEMVFRAVANPNGATQDTTGPFTVSFGPEAAQRIYLSKSDKVILRGRWNGAFTIDPGPPAPPVPLPAVNTGYWP